MILSGYWPVIREEATAALHPPTYSSGNRTRQRTLAGKASEIMTSFMRIFILMIRKDDETPPLKVFFDALYKIRESPTKDIAYVLSRTETGEWTAKHPLHAILSGSLPALLIIYKYRTLKKYSRIQRPSILPVAPTNPSGRRITAAPFSISTPSLPWARGSAASKYASPRGSIPRAS